MKKAITLLAIVLILGLVGFKVSSSASVSDSVLNKCCHALKDDPTED